MKALILFLFSLLILPLTVNAQSYEEIQREAYPEYNNIIDNSEYAQTIRALHNARRSGNTKSFNNILQQLHQNYPEKFQGQVLPENRNILIPTLQSPVKVGNIPYAPDWANEITVFSGSISGSSPGNPRANRRMLRMAHDTNGVLFVACLDPGRDTAKFFKSTDKGLTWSNFQNIAAGSGMKYQCGDFAITDTTGGFKIGMVTSLYSIASGSYSGSIYYSEMLPDGSGYTVTLIHAPTAGKGCIGAAIVTDGWDWSPGSTYWYVCYQVVNSTTGSGANEPTIAAYSADWGASWTLDTARGTYNDYELDIDYNFGADTIYVLLTNNLTVTNENLRFRYIALNDLGSSTAWKQYNPATTSNPEYEGCIAVNRPTNEMAVSYTLSSSGNEDIQYSYTTSGSFPMVNNVPVTSQANDVTRSHIYSLAQQNNSFRICYVSESSFDTVIYKNTFTIASGFGATQIVSMVNQSTGTIIPVVNGYKFSGSYGAGVIYAGVGPANVYFNGSDIISEIKNVNTTVPDEFTLNQNYPNPFNPETKINFSIPKNTIVTLNVYDITGKEVATLVNQQLSTGVYEVSLNGKNLSSGVYFYTLSAGDFIDTKKMLLIK
ncbi:T9SS type A sorting domain-containing protein [Bacteroidota bacterium]